MTPKESLIRAYLHNGDTFIDVGASTGHFSRLAAQIVGPDGSVIAIEPDENSLPELYQNLEDYENAVVIAAAALNYHGEAQLYRSSVIPDGARLFDHSESVPPVTIPTFPLDDLHLSRIDFLKIDAQGSDHAVVYGARKTIIQHQPLIVVDWWPDGIRAFGTDPLNVLQFYERLGYEISGVGVSEIPFKDSSCPLFLEPK